MEFEDVLAQTITLLQGQGRISYGALKRRLQLDDAYLDDLKVELIEAQQLARDENGRILVWTGETTPPPPTQDDQASPDEGSRVAPRVADAERRQLTVLFSIWPTRPAWRDSSIPKTCARLSAPTRPPA